MVFNENKNDTDRYKDIIINSQIKKDYEENKIDENNNIKNNQFNDDDIYSEKSLSLTNENNSILSNNFNKNYKDKDQKYYSIINYISLKI